MDRSGAGFVTWNRYHGSFRGRICDVEQVPGTVAGARDVAVAGTVTLQGPLQAPGTLRWQDCDAARAATCARLRRVTHRNMYIDIFISIHIDVHTYILES